MQTKGSIFNGKKSKGKKCTSNDIFFDIVEILFSQSWNNYPAFIT
tara:strand:- start:1183 stop:1317 length:135 start_codon:yes stop_codon:yes gene_type:complete